MDGSYPKLLEGWRNWRGFISVSARGLEGEIPPEIGGLSYLKVLDLCGTRICHVPSTINMLSCLSTLDLTSCNEITELPELPASLVILRVESRSLQVVPNLSNLSNLEELFLSDGADYGVLPYGSECRLRRCDLGWIGRLSKLKKFELRLFNVAAPPTELGDLSLLENLSLHRLDLQALQLLPPSLSYLKLDNLNTGVSQLSNLKFLSSLTLCFSKLREIELNGLLQLHRLSLTACLLKRLSIPSSLRTLSVFNCPKLMEITGMLESLEELSIHSCNSFERLGCDEVGSLGVLDPSESSSSALSCYAPGVLLTDALKKLKRLEMIRCEGLVEIRVVGMLLSLQDVIIRNCDGMEKFSISPLKNLQNMVISDCRKLRVVEGLDELEFLVNLELSRCPSLEISLDISNSKIQDKCLIKVCQCGESLGTSHHRTFKRYKKMIL
ncbi:putative disease resistance protein RGA3 [Rhodamnia argentea]|uniref:Disease resistance protein RGA3 n=1 Tax=Rhodamnia argentea TaxID=178133 RepID=A0A8B8NLV2_9MYRT|nr:putative disease resistance protein RGA3 [Rhodamnia argentea]